MPTDRLTESLLMFWRELHLLSNPVEQGEITAQQYWLLRQLNLRGRSSIGELATAGQMLGAITRAEAASLAEVGDREDLGARVEQEDPADGTAEDGRQQRDDPQIDPKS